MTFVMAFVMARQFNWRAVSACWAGRGQADGPHPGEQVEGELDDLQPDLVLRTVVEGQVA